MAPICPYCGKESMLSSGAAIYPHLPRLAYKPIYVCFPCDAYVGCHPGTTKALGRLANAELRKAKIAAHAVFDPIWRNGTMSRRAAYRWLTLALGLSEPAHIGEMDIEGCERVIEVVTQAQP
jgi:hypothetical protein